MSETIMDEQSVESPGEHPIADSADHSTFKTTINVTPAFRKARVQGQDYLKMPEDLYIPPDAMEVFLEAFEGPLDLLLYLIRKQNLNILDIPVAEITRQYMEYIELMHALRLELAAEYLVMAAMLAEIKSRLLLPRPVDEEDEDDPRADLVRRLQEYERFKKAAEDLDALPRRGRDTFGASVMSVNFSEENKKVPEVALQDLLFAFKEVLHRAALLTSHHISREPLSLRERMTRILTSLQEGKFIPFHECFDIAEGRAGVVVTFVAILELFRNSVIEVVQSEPYAPIYIKAATGAHDNDIGEIEQE